MMADQYRALGSVRGMRWFEWVLLVVLTIIPLIGGFVGARSFNTGKYKNDQFEKPDWAPPSWAFSPVWCILYLMMGFASFLIWKLGDGFNSQSIPPLLIYLIQLLINWTWTPIFFGLGNFGAALMVICALWSLVLTCVITFMPVSKVAALLMVPYFLWVSFASALNYSIVCLNGCYINGTTPQHNVTF